MSDHPTVDSLRHFSTVIPNDCDTIKHGQPSQCRLAKQNQRIAQTAAAEAFAEARQWQSTTALVKTLSWMRDLAMLELAESARAQCVLL